MKRKWHEKQGAEKYKSIFYSQITAELQRKETERVRNQRNVMIKF